MAVPAMQIELPGHIYLADLAALEEQLLVGAYRRLCGVQVGAACPPVTTTASRNDLIAMAHEHLGGPDLRAFLNYAESLDFALEGQVIVDLSRPIGSHDNTAPPAEQLAWHFLKEGKGSVWASVRAAVSQLRWETDSRAFAQGNGLRWACLPNLEVPMWQIKTYICPKNSRCQFFNKKSNNATFSTKKSNVSFFGPTQHKNAAC